MLRKDAWCGGHFEYIPGSNDGKAAIRIAPGSNIESGCARRSWLSFRSTTRKVLGDATARSRLSPTPPHPLQNCHYSSTPNNNTVCQMRKHCLTCRLASPRCALTLHRHHVQGSLQIRHPEGSISLSSLQGCDNDLPPIDGNRS